MLCSANLRSGLLVSVAMSASIAHAQDVSGDRAETIASQEPAASQGVADIVVTAQRREERLQDVPISVSAISRADLERRGIEGLDDLQTGSVPGLVLYRGNGLATQVSANIRGVTVADPAQGTAEQGVAVYIDGVYLGRSQGLGMDLVDAERIEVLRGPQGTLFGRNAEGGAIQVVTRPPSGIFEMDAGVTLGNYGLNKQFAHVNLPEVAGFSTKLDFFRSQHDGYVKNGPRQASLSQQRDFLEEEGIGWRAAVRWQPIDEIVIDYAYDWSRTDYTTSYYALFDRTGVSPTGRPLDTGRPERSWMPLYSPELRTTARGHMLNIAADLTDQIQIRSITAFRKVDDIGVSQTAGANSFLALPGLPVTGVPADAVYGRTGLTAGQDLFQKQASQELQFIGSFPRLDLTAGLYYYEEEASDERYSAHTVWYTAPGPSAPISIDPIVTARPNLQSVESRLWAMYAQATWTPPLLDDRLELTAGLRYSDDRKKAQRTIQNGVLLPEPIEAAPFEAERLDPAFTVKYNFSDDVNAYLRYAQAYRAGGVSVRSPTFVSYDEEVAKQWELGLKSRFFDRQVQLNLALYQNRISDMQVNVFVDPANSSRVDTINIPTDFVVRGLESEFVFSPSRDFTLAANYTFQDQNDPSYAVDSVPVTLLAPVVPKHSFFTSVDYVLGRIATGNLRAHADYSVSSGFYRPGLETSLTQRALFKSKVDTLNARLALEDLALGNAGVTVSAWVRNLLDTEYVAFSSNGGGVIFGDPRTFGLDLRVTF